MMPQEERILDRIATALETLASPPERAPGAQVIDAGVRIVQSSDGFDPDTGWRLGQPQRRYMIVQYRWPSPGVTLGWGNTYMDRKIFDVTDADLREVSQALAGFASHFGAVHPEWTRDPR